MLQAITEEYMTFSSGALRLRGVLSYPEETAPERAVLMCSPHPHFAGDMNNNVICAVARRLAVHAAVLRFDYRGVGDSEIVLDCGSSVFDYWTEVEEKKDYRDAIEDVESAATALQRATESFDVELSVVGYSFGAAAGMMFAHKADDVHKMVAIAPPLGKVSFEFLSCCSKPCLHLVGKRDFLYSEERVEAFRRTLGSAARVVVLENADHFFRGDEDALAQKVDEFIREIPGECKVGE